MATSDQRPGGPGEWKEQVGAIRPETLDPGYWDNLHQNAEDWARSVSVGPFWNAAKQKVIEWSNSFQRERGGALLPEIGLPDFRAKGAARTGEKAFARREKDNKKYGLILGVWPEKGPPVPELGDVVRTRVECLFLDGVEYLADRLEQLATARGGKPRRYRKAEDGGGYYAQHFYFQHEDYYRVLGGREPVTVTCEVQIATVLSTRVWAEAHKVYEARRVSAREDETAQWNPKDPRFIARQLGHMVHLADGILMQLRDAGAKKGEK